MKTGALIGADKYGNKYFEDEKSFFGESCVFLNRGDICRTFLDYYGLIYKQILKCFCSCYLGVKEPLVRSVVCAQDVTAG